jgi:hypothetical protein
MYVAKKKFTYVTKDGAWANLYPGQELDMTTVGDVLLASLISVGHVVKKEAPIDVAAAVSSVESVSVESASTDNRGQQGKRKGVSNEQA